MSYARKMDQAANIINDDDMPVDVSVEQIEARTLPDPKNRDVAHADEASEPRERSAGSD